MHPALQHLDHRPWSLPIQPWTWRQNWYNLLFAHWPVPASEVRRLVPAGLNIQEFEGTSWFGVVPFHMTGVMRRPIPNLPWVSAFPELNLRLYVERDGKPGVWFLSLDASNPLAVWAAKRYFYLPYWHSRMRFHREAERVRFRSDYAGPSRKVQFEADYYPISEPYLAPAGSLERFLTERYCLYSQSPRGGLYRCEVHHKPWPLQKAAGTVLADQLLAPHGLTTRGAAPILHYSPGVEVVVWSLEELD